MNEGSYLLIWFDNGNLQACELVKVPYALTYKDEIFRAERGYFGDVDYLRDEKNRLVGFAYYLAGKWEEVIRDRLLSQSNNVRLDDGIFIILLEACSYEYESMAAMGTEIYRSPTNKVMIAVPNWGFGDLAFDLTTINTPTIALPKI